MNVVLPNGTGSNHTPACTAIVKKDPAAAASSQTSAACFLHDDSLYKHVDRIRRVTLARLFCSFGIVRQSDKLESLQAVVLDQAAFQKTDVVLVYLLDELYKEQALQLTQIAKQERVAVMGISRLEAEDDQEEQKQEILRFVSESFRFPLYQDYKKSRTLRKVLRGRSTSGNDLSGMAIDASRKLLGYLPKSLSTKNLLTTKIIPKVLPKPDDLMGMLPTPFRKSDKQPPSAAEALDISKDASEKSAGGSAPPASRGGVLIFDRDAQLRFVSRSCRRRSPTSPEDSTGDELLNAREIRDAILHVRLDMFEEEEEEDAPTEAMTVASAEDEYYAYGTGTDESDIDFP